MARQDGVIARRQVLRAGVTAGQIRQRLESGRWLVVHPSVYRSVEHQFTTAARVRAAGLWGGENAFLYGTAAAWWWGLPAEGAGHRRCCHPAERAPTLPTRRAGGSPKAPLGTTAPGSAPLR